MPVCGPPPETMTTTQLLGSSSLTAPASSEDQLKGSFSKFLWYVFKSVLMLPVPTRVQLDIARWLEAGPTQRMIQAFRGVGK